MPHELAALGFGLETFVEVKPLRHAVTSEVKLSRQFKVLRQALQHQVAVSYTHLDVYKRQQSRR